MNKLVIISLLVFILYSCKENSTYKPDNLKKLSKTEALERVKQKRFSNFESLVFKNEKGEIIPHDSIQKISLDAWTYDSYVNEEGEVLEMIVRKAEPSDLEFHQKVKALTTTSKIVEPLPSIEIDCKIQTEILQKIYQQDQENRQSGKAINPPQDRTNLATVISLINKCGFPSVKEVGNEGMTAIWLVLQHADLVYQKKYLPQLEIAAQKGDLDKKQIAMLKDRILMREGKPQIYGTQVKKNNSGEWVLYDLESPYTVDKRRAEIGFGPLQDYLRRWNIVFDVEQES